MKGTKPNMKTDRAAITNRAAPAWLPKDAKAEWRRVMPILSDRRILTEADLGSVENYCLAIARVREMERLIQTDGAVVTVTKLSAAGVATVVSIKRHPAYAILSDAMNKARLLAAEIGCTPVSRSRPSVEDPGDDDDLFSDGGQ